MSIFEENDDEEINKEIISDILELYEAIINKNTTHLEKGITAYWTDYERILKKLDHCFQGDLFSEYPDFLEELINDVRPSEYSYFRKPATEIRIMESGLKKIMRNLKIEIPEKEQRTNGEKTTPHQIIITQNQSQTQHQKNNIYNSQVNEVLINLEKELKKPIQNKSKIREWINKSIDLGSEAVILTLKLINKILF